MHRRTCRFLSAFLIACAAGATQAAELGDARVASHIGQQLVADIELTSLSEADARIEVRLASHEVYNEAGIALPPALSALNLSVMRRDGRQFLHVTTLRPVEADHLHLYLEVVDHGERSVRLATLWLTPDPNPAPAVIPARVAVVPAPPTPVAAPPTPVAAPVSAAPAIKPVPATLPPTPTPAPATPEASPSLGAKNAELRTRIGQLEARVKGLQARLGVEQQGGKASANPPAEVSAASHPIAHTGAPKTQPHDAAPMQARDAAARPAAPKAPRPISSIKPLVPHKQKPKEAPADDGLPWGVIGGATALLAFAGAAVVWLRARGKRAHVDDASAAPGGLSRLRQRFFTHGPVRGAGRQVAEPSLE